MAWKFSMAGSVVKLPGGELSIIDFSTGLAASGCFCLGKLPGFLLAVTVDAQ